MFSSDEEGVAIAVDNSQLLSMSTLCIIGRALEDKDSDTVDLMEVAVGKN